MRVALFLTIMVIGAVCVQAEKPFQFRRDTINVEDWNADSMTGTPESNWDVIGPNSVVAVQTTDSVPTVFLDPEADIGLAYTTSITVNTTNDNDFIGLVVAFVEGDFSSATANYILIDWRQGTEPVTGGSSRAGLAASVVRGATNQRDLALHSGSVREIARGRTLGSTGWDDNTEHTIAIIFSPDRLVVRVDGDVEINVGPPAQVPGFQNGFNTEGSFGFYSFSQEVVSFQLRGREPVITATAQRQVNFARRFVANDDGEDDTYTLTTSWGDNSPNETSTVESSPVRQSHTYAEQGVYPASFRLVNQESQNEDIFFAFFLVSPPAGGGDPTDPTVDPCDESNRPIVTVSQADVDDGSAFGETDGRCFCLRVV